MARRQDTGILPYILTFCRPSNVPTDGMARQIFAIISDGFHEERIAVWPKLGLPFPMNPRRILSVRIFVADDEAVFERGAGKEVAACYLPVWRLPDVAPASSRADGDLPELWLALEPPRPVRDGAAGVGGTTAASAAAASYTGGPSAWRDSEASREQEEAELQAELLGRFERARELALEDPDVPRICVIVQARQDISSVMSAMMRHNFSSHFGGTGLVGYPVSSWPLGGADVAVGASGGHVVIQEGASELSIAGGAAAIPWSMANGGAALTGPAQFPVETGLLPSGIQAANLPQRSHHTGGIAFVCGASSGYGDTGATKPSVAGRPTSSDDFWKMKWNEERRRLEEQRARYQREMQARRLDARRHCSRLERVGIFVEERVLRCWEAACFSLWCLWLVDEKRQRQFEQLSDECARFEDIRDEHMERLAGEVEGAALRLHEQDEVANMQLQAWLERLPVIEALLGHDSSGRLLSRSIAAWHARAARRVSAKRLFAERRHSARRGGARLALASWRAQVGWQQVEEVQQKVRAACAELPLQVRRACAENAFRALRFSGADVDGGASLAASRAELLGGALTAWARATMATVVLRQRIGLFLRSNLRAGLEVALPLCCLVLWHGLVSTTEAATAAERRIGCKVLDHCRRRGARLLQAALKERVACNVYAAILCWHFFVARKNLQGSLEQVFDEHQRAKERTMLLEGELQSLRSCHENELDRLQHQGAILACALGHAEIESERCAAVLREVVQDRLDGETRRSDALARSQALVDELFSAQMQGVRAASQCESVEEMCEAAEREARTMVIEYEEEREAAHLGMNKMQQEAARIRDRRHRDVRDARQQLRLQITRQEDGAVRLERAHRDDEEHRAQKLRHAEGRASRLHEEVQQFRQGVHNLPARAAALQEQGAEILAHVIGAEEDLQAAESFEQRRRLELAELKGAREELRARCEALELACGISFAEPERHRS